MRTAKPSRLHRQVTFLLAAGLTGLAAPAWAGIPQLTGFDAVRLWEITYYT